MAEFRGDLRGQGKRIAIVVSRFNALVTERLTAGARACLVENGVAPENIDHISVPGAWELALAAQAAARNGYDAIIAIGCVIRGDTPHFDYVAGAAAHGLERVSLDSGLPIAFGVLTTDTPDQALERAGGRHGNKGWDAAEVALELANLLTELKSNARS